MLEIVPTKQLVHAWGRNEGSSKLLAQTKKTRLLVPQKLKLQLEVKAIASNERDIMLLSKQGEVYQYANGAAKRLSQLSSIVKIKAGENHFVALDGQGKCYAWGSGSSGCLGNYSFKDLERPTAVMMEHKIRDIECGSHSTFFVTEQGETFSCGSNTHGELAINSIKHCCLPHKIDAKGIIVVQIAAGKDHTLFLSKEGNIYVSGSGTQGQLGISDQLSELNCTRLQKIQTKVKFTKVAASNYSAALSSEGVVFVWGTSLFGTKSIPTAFSKQSSNFVDLALGVDSGYALTSSGEVWAWGLNSHGQLGLGDVKPRDKPFPIIQLDKYAVDKIYPCGDGRVFCISSAEYQKKVFERECCGGHNQSSHHHTHHHERMGILKERNKQNKELNRSLVSVGTKSKSNQSKLSSVIQFNRSKPAKGVSKKKTKGKENPQKAIIVNKNPKKKQQESFKTSERNSLNNDPVGSDAFNTDVIVNTTKHRAVTNISAEGWFDRIRSGTPEPKLSSQFKHFTGMKHDTAACEQQKAQLQLIIKEKDFVIRDITEKIAMLEQAIAEKEKRQNEGLEHLDYIEELRKNERRYLQQIQKLTKMINSLIGERQLSMHCQTEEKYARHQRSTSDNPHIEMVDMETQNYSILRSLNPSQRSNVHAATMKEQLLAMESRLQALTQDHQLVLKQKTTQITQLTQSLKDMERNLLEKERTIFTLRKQLLDRQHRDIHNSRHGKSLQSQLVSASNMKQQPQQRIHMESRDEDCSGIIEASKQRRNNHLPNIEVERTLQRIEQNRQRISHSANKLIHILDMSI